MFQANAFIQSKVWFRPNDFFSPQIDSSEFHFFFFLTSDAKNFSSTNDSSTKFERGKVSWKIFSKIFFHPPFNFLAGTFFAGEPSALDGSTGPV